MPKILTRCYNAPISDGWKLFGGGVKNRLDFVENDPWNQYAIQGEKIERGFLGWLKETFYPLFGKYLVVAIKKEKFLLKRKEALYRLQIFPDDLKRALRKDKKQDTHTHVTKLIKEAAERLPFKPKRSKFIWHPDLRLDQMRFLASHNACLNSEEGWVYAQQNWSLLRQLDAGVRAFEMDVGANNKGELQICHRSVFRIPYLNLEIRDPLKGFRRYKTVEQQFKEINAWLQKQENKGEILIIRIDNMRDRYSQASCLDFVIDQCAELHSFKELLFTPADLKKECPDGMMPTVRQMRALGKRVMLISYKKGTWVDEKSYLAHHAADVLREIVIKGHSLQVKKSKHGKRRSKMTMVLYASNISSELAFALISPFYHIPEIPKNDPDEVEALMKECQEKIHKEIHPSFWADFIDELILAGELERINQENKKQTLIK